METIRPRQWVTIRIETKSREFDSKMLLTYGLVKAGYGVVITNKIGSDMSVFPKGAYLINSLFANVYPYVLRLKKHGEEIVFMDEEGLIYISDERFIKRIDKRSLELVSQVYCFGDNQANLIREHFPEAKDKVFVTGNPRLSLLNEEFLSMCNSEIEDVKRRHSGYILVVSNFTIANFGGTGGDAEEKRKSLKAFFSKMEVSIESELDEQIEYVGRQWREMKRLISYISERFPDIRIIVRPHPSEDETSWREFAEGKSNVEIIREGSLIPWLVNAGLVIQNCCTSAIECSLLRVPCISYRPIVDDRFDQPLPSMVTKNVNTLEEVCDYVRELAENGIVEMDMKTMIDKASAYMSNLDGDQSVREIVRHIKALDIPYVLYDKRVNYRKHYSVMRAPFILKQLLKYMIRKTPNNIVKVIPERYRQFIILVKNDSGKTKYGDISAILVDNKMAELSRIYGDGLKYTVAQAGDEIIITD